MHIKTVIYIDVLLLVNFLISLFLLLTVGLLCHQNAKLLHLLIASTVAAIATFILFAPEMPLAIQFLYQLCSAAIVIKLAYPCKETRRFLQLIVWYYLLNLLLAGLATAIILQSEISLHILQSNNLSTYLYISPTLLVLCVILVYLFLKVFVCCCAPPSETFPVQELMIEIHEQPIKISAFYDTGFSLHDSFSDKRIILLSFPSIRAQLPLTIQKAVEQAQKISLSDEKDDTHNFSDAAIRYLVCDTIAGSRLLPAICAKTVYHIKTPQRKAENILIAFCNTPHFANGANALFGADLFCDLLQEKESAHAKTT